MGKRLSRTPVPSQSSSVLAPIYAVVIRENTRLQNDSRASLGIYCIVCILQGIIFLKSASSRTNV